MLWNERLAQARKELGKSQEQVVREMARYLPRGETVSVGALSSWEVGRTQPKVHHALALARVLGDADVNYLFGTGLLSDGLNDEGLLKLAEYRRLLLDSPRFRAQPPQPERRTIPIYLQAASAGTGQFLNDEAAEVIEADDSVPANAEFGVRLAGDSMTPRFADGQIVWARRRDTAENGEIVLCYYDGQSYCKKLHIRDGQPELVSLNPRYQPIPVRPEAEFRVFGVVVG